MRTQGFVRVPAGGSEPASDQDHEVKRTGPLTPRHVSGRVFTWTLSLNRFPPKPWRDLFTQTKDKTIDYTPDKIRFYQQNLIFDSDEDMVPTWIQFITRWMLSANERYFKQLEAEHRARQAQADLDRDPRERLRDAAEKFKNL